MQKGFSLIELMVTVMIIAILSAIALPAYGTYVRQGKLAVAAGALNSYAQQMQQFYADNRTYASGSNCGIAVPAAELFSLGCTIAASGAQFTVTADNLDGVGLGAAGDYSYSLDSTLAKTTVKFEGTTINASGWKYK